MAEGRNPQQTTMHGAWQDSEAAERCRWQQLGFACERLGDADLLLLMALVYKNTRQGLGAAWEPEKGWRTLLADPWGPRCKRSKVLRLIADARDAGILRVVASEQFGSPAGSAYQIDWPGVYALRGLPLPELLRSSSSGPRESRRDHQSDWLTDPSTPVDTPSTPVDTLQVAPKENGSQRAPTRAFDLKTRLEEEEFIFKSSHSTAADALVRAIYRHRGGCPSLSRRSRVFLLSVVVLGERLGPPWLEAAVEATAERRADTPPAFLFTCLENGIAEHFALPREMFRTLLARVRSVVQRFLHEHPWNPEEAFPRRMPAAEDPEPSESEKDAGVAAALATMHPAMRKRALKTLSNLEKAGAET